MTGSRSTSATKSEELLDVGGKKIPPGAVRVVQQDGVHDERQKLLTAIQLHLQANRCHDTQSTLEQTLKMK